ncbi:TauD/TfdA family dioxygenase [Azospirillum agricola]|uniref:TauD/TfdA family dioxygenase n=1 Tax=Azospirillum agricola TaxID=1720247 RepID=UPI000A0F1AB7|nr:TauD/TfdA family dioxygenase [Azospirillum agricola]SMH47680.1 Taurine dioxygenase, alpha-ketoglutarate-dependent [Azospirillum lipoferum]
MSSGLTVSDLFAGSSIAVVTPPADGTGLIAWADDRRDAIRALLADRGAVLLRGFEARPVAGLEDFLSLFSQDLLTYVNQSTPRTRVDGKVYTTTEYPANHTIPQHCEMAYHRDWPMLLAFQCVVPATTGGETPLADMERVTARIGTERMARFRERGVLYVRNYGHGVDLPWQTVFQTDVPGEVEAYCRANGMDFAWLGGDRLRTSHVCQGTAIHPGSGKELWFNQANLFHISSLPAELQEAMIAMFGEDDLPRNAFHGDGSPIAAADLEAVREAFAAETLAFPWQAGDMLLIDNMRYSHGRNPFTGPRRVVVAMSDPHSALI